MEEDLYLFQLRFFCNSSSGEEGYESMDKIECGRLIIGDPFKIVCRRL